MIVGKGMAWSRAEAEVRGFIERTRCRSWQLADGQGRGARRPPAVGRRRSLARAAGGRRVLLLGARLNWIMHFGLPPRFAPDVQIIQLDISAEQIVHNVPAEVALVGDGRPIDGPAQRRARRRAVVVSRPTAAGAGASPRKIERATRGASRRWPTTTRCR